MLGANDAAMGEVCVCVGGGDSWPLVKPRDVRIVQVHIFQDAPCAACISIYTTKTRLVPPRPDPGSPWGDGMIVDIGCAHMA